MAGRKQAVYQRANASKYREYARKYYTKLKLDAISALGGRCACCGESDSRFLTLDRVSGGGGAVRDRMTGSKHCYRRARDEGYPVDVYQILCWNCNCGRSVNGGVCPHKGAK